MTKETYSGYIALIGRPNVGKSTLLNRLLGQKLAITSKKPQTTRHRILGINTQDKHQLIYVDTPGIHLNGKKAVNRLMNKASYYAIEDVDLAVFLVEAGQFNDEDELALSKLKKANIPVILAINKVDKFKDKSQLLPFIEKLQQKHDFSEIIPISAKNKINLDSLESHLCALLPQGPHFYEKSQLTDRSERFIVSEYIREKVFRTLGQELPYGATVVIEKMQTENNLSHICALILVDKDSHKRMIIGKGGHKLKTIGQTARFDIEKMLNRKVFLELWVKVKSGWADNNRMLQELGYSA